MRLQMVFTVLILMQFVVIACHDLVTIPGWVSGSQVQAVIGRRKVWLATLVNSIFPGLAVAFALFWWQQPKPAFAKNYWAIYCGVTLLSAVGMWYVPYLLGTNEKQSKEYEQMYAGTKQVLPARRGNPRPNLTHICFHVLFVATFAVAMVIRFGGV